MEPAQLIVDAMNVIGSRPDGWWRDRAGALRALVRRLTRYAEESGAAVIVVMDGAPTPIGVDANDGVEVRFAPGGPNAADIVIAGIVDEAADPMGVVVVTSDRALARRVAAAGATVRGARWLLDELDARER